MIINPTKSKRLFLPWAAELLDQFAYGGSAVDKHALQMEVEEFLTEYQSTFYPEPKEDEPEPTTEP